MDRNHSLLGIIFHLFIFCVKKSLARDVLVRKRYYHLIYMIQITPGIIYPSRLSYSDWDQDSNLTCTPEWISFTTSQSNHQCRRIAYMQTRTCLSDSKQTDLIHISSVCFHTLDIAKPAYRNAYVSMHILLVNISAMRWVPSRRLRGEKVKPAFEPGTRLDYCCHLLHSIYLNSVRFEIQKISYGLRCGMCPLKSGRGVSV